MKNAYMAFIGLLFLTTALAGCTTDNGGAEGEVVDMQNFQFQPKELEVEPGTTVVWINRDSTFHTVTAEDDSFDSGNIQASQQYTRTFDEPGIYEYYCKPHATQGERTGMVGTIVVLNEDGSRPTETQTGDTDSDGNGTA